MPTITKNTTAVAPEVIPASVRAGRAAEARAIAAATGRPFLKVFRELAAAAGETLAEYFR